MPKKSQTTLLIGPENSKSVASQSPENQTLTSGGGEVCPPVIPTATQASAQQSSVSLTSDGTSNAKGHGQDSFLQLKDGRFLISNIPLRRLTQPATVKGSVLKTLQVWEGTITGLDELNFVAVLRDLTKPSNPDEQAEFARTEVSEDDQELLTPGSTFYWVVGTECTLGGRKKNISTLQFRRLPRWTDNVLGRASERAAFTRNIFRSAE